MNGMATTVPVRRRSRRWLILIVPLLACAGTVALSALSNLTLPPAPARLDQLSPLDKSRLQETLHLKAALGDTLWPNFGAMDIPVVLWNSDYTFLVGEAQPPAGWEPVPGDDFDGQIYYRQPAHDPQNFAVRVGDRWAACLSTKWEMDNFLVSKFREMMPAPLKPVFPYRLIIQPSEVQMTGVLHEAFHVYQVETAQAQFDEAEKAYRDGTRYWEADPGMRADWTAEIDLLEKAVQAPSDAEAKAWARQFLAQRQRRRQAHGLDAPRGAYERRFEWPEGLAKYTELGAWRAAATTAGYAALPGLNADPTFSHYSTYPQRWSQELDQLRRQADQAGETRLYYTGLAQAALLDRYLPGWKARVMAQGAWLEDLLAEAVK